MPEVVEMVRFARKIEDCREAGLRLANRRLQPLGHLTANAKYKPLQHLNRSRFYIPPIQRFFKPLSLRNSAENRAHFATAADEVWAHSQEALRKSDGSSWRALCVMAWHRIQQQFTGHASAQR